MKRLCRVLAALVFLALLPTSRAIAGSHAPPGPPASKDMTERAASSLRILYAPAEADNPDLRNAVAALTGGTVDYLDSRTTTPTPQVLAAYNVVYTWPHGAYANASLMGDRLADFVDAGGRVILGTFCTFTTGNSMQGRIMTPAYSPVTSPMGTNHFGIADYAHDGGACMYSGIPNFGFYDRDVLALQGAGAADGHYLDGEIAMAYRPDFHVIYCNAVLVGSGFAICLDMWPRLIANACVCTSAIATLPERSLPARCANCIAAPATQARAEATAVGRPSAAARLNGDGNLAPRTASPPNTSASVTRGAIRSNLGRETTGRSANVLTPPAIVTSPRMLYAPTEADDPPFRAAIATITGGTVDYFDARFDTPSPELLATYDCVYTWVNDRYASSVLFGDRLADFVDAGGKAILGVFCTLKSNNSLAGRIMTSGYCPVRSELGSNHDTNSSSAGDGATCIHTGVGSYGNSYRDVLVTQGPGRVDGHYADGEIAMAYRPDFRVIYSNGAGAAQLGAQPGNWPRLVANASMCSTSLPAPSRPALMGCSSDGELFSLDVATGAGTWVGNLPTKSNGLGATEIVQDAQRNRSWVQAREGHRFDQQFNMNTGAGSGLPIANGAAYQGLEYIGPTLYATSIPGGCGPSILYAPTDNDNPSFRAAIESFTGGPVDYFDARVCTPTPELLSNYDCVYTWVNGAYADRTLFGDRLADFVDRGGHVVLGVFCTYTSGNSMGGRIMTTGYCPVASPAGSNHVSSASWTGDFGSNCIHGGVAAYGANFRDFLVLQGGGIAAGTYSDGELSQARRLDSRVIYSNGTGALDGSFGDWVHLVANAAMCGFSRTRTSTLQTLDPTTGVASAIGSTGVGPIVGLASDPGTSILYGLTGCTGGSSQLVSIDRSTGAATLVASFAFDGASLEFGPDGKLYAGGSVLDGGKLYRIDIGGGTAALVGQSGFGSVTGLAKLGPLVDVPPVAVVPEGLSLEGLWPNPAAGGLHVSFTLARSAPARLELIDVAGRVVRTRDVGALGGGHHVVELSQGRPIPVGMYMVRITQSGVAQSKRAIILR